MTLATLEQPPTASPVALGGADKGRLVIDSVTKFYETTGVPVLQNISLTCQPGEFVVVVGPSGCGKTTLLNLAAGMIRPDQGTISLDGKPITAPGPERAMVFQEHGLFSWLTAAQNVDFGLKMAGFPKSERKDRVAEALKMVHLSHIAKKYPHQLSGGMRQRVSIARALVIQPAVLLMDEPFAALDAQTRFHLHEELQELWLKTHKTILFITHSIAEAVRLADRVVVMHAHPGRIRNEIKVTLSHPRKSHSDDVAHIVRIVRREIEEEVNRVNAQLADEFRPRPAADDLDDDSGDLGGGI
ncbi:MAG TPA: ABC transporter ATP-binding protein [Tepidisphaeraceae bacterium]|jgi:NitT/TauT family transport system ATP-binding protein|nr:ABC transporter ATP-binding protein [Tepidisphaeraceae bacterium]